MRNVLSNMCGKFNNDRLRNDRALENRKSDYNNSPMEQAQDLTTFVALGDPFPGPTMWLFEFNTVDSCKPAGMDNV